jgi:hypothetical protein
VGLEVLFLDGFLLGLLFDPEDGNRIFLCNTEDFYWTT